MLGITQKQLYAYFTAHRAACLALGLHDKEQQEAYRKQVMREEAGVESVKDLNRTTDYDKVMSRFCIDCGDYQAAIKYNLGTDTRLVKMVEILAQQVAQLLGTNPDKANDYVAGIIFQAGFSTKRLDSQGFLLDIATCDLWRVFQMLDTHRRRLIQRYGRAPDCPKTFNIHLVYDRSQGGKVHAVRVNEPISAFRIAQ